MAKHKKYEKYKDSGVEWIGEVPEHWNLKKVKHVFNNLDYKRIPLSSEERGKMDKKIYDYYGASGIIDKVDDYIFDDTLILIGEDGANLYSRNTPLAFLARGKYWVNNHAHILKPKNGEINFLVNSLESLDYTNFISGSAQPKLTQDNLGSMFIAEPPLNEQKQIAKFLDKKTSEIDALIADKEKLITLLEEKRQAIITEAVTKGLNPNVKMKDSGVQWIGKIPEEWEAMPLKYLTKFVSRGNSPDYIEESSIGVINQACIYWDEIKIENVKYQDDSKKCIDSFKGRLNYGDLMMNSTGTGTLGRVNVFKLRGDFIADSHVTIIRCKDELLNFEYLNYLLRTELYQGYVYSSLVNGATNQIELSRERLLNTPIVVPKIQEQKEVLAYLNSVKQLNLELIEDIKLQIQKLKEYRQALISEAVTGKIDVRDYFKEA